MRISSASIPPATKKTKLTSRYMIPILLWSTVAIHPSHPDVYSSCRVLGNAGATIGTYGASLTAVSPNTQ